MKRILFIHHAAGWGGAPINMVNIIKHLDKEKYGITVLLLKDSIVSEKLKEFSINYIVADSWFYRKVYKYYTHTIPGYLPWYRLLSQLINIFLWICSRYYFAGRELDKVDFDIVHLNSSVLTDWLRPAKLRGKVIYHVQEPLTKGLFGIRYSFFRNIVSRNADRIIAISIDNSRRLDLLDKTTVIYNFVDNYAVQYKPESLFSKKVLYLGGDQKIKGFYTMVHALDYVDDDIQVLFGGSYSTISKNTLKKCIKKFLVFNYKDKYIRKMRSHKNAKEVGLIFDVDQYLSDVCCLVSPFEVIHFSRPIIESLYFQKPVIVTNIEGVDEVVVNEVNGLVVSKKNPNELAKAINFICNHGEIGSIMGRQGRALVENKFSIKNVKQVEFIYDSLD